MKQHTTEHLLTRESSRVLHTKLNNKQNQDQTKGVFYHNTVSFSFTCSTNSAEQGRLLFPPFLKPEYKKNSIFMSRVYETKKAFSRRRSEHTDRNVKLKPTVLFRTTPTHQRQSIHGVTTNLSMAYFHHAKFQILLKGSVQLLKIIIIIKPFLILSNGERLIV